MAYRYLIWSFEHRMWWMPNEAGYTPDVKQAGRYDAQTAGRIVTDSVMCEEVAVLEQVAERNGPPSVRGLWAR